MFYVPSFVVFQEPWLPHLLQLCQEVCIPSVIIINNVINHSSLSITTTMNIIRSSHIIVCDGSLGHLHTLSFVW